MTKFACISIIALCFSFGPAFAIAPPSDTELRYSDYRLNGDVRTADPYILQILKEHEREFPGAIRHSSLFFYTPLSRLDRVQQLVLLELHAKTDFAKKWQEKTELFDFTATVKKSAATKGDSKVLSLSDWDNARSTWSSALFSYTNSTDSPDEMIKNLKLEVERRLAVKADVFYIQDVLPAFILASRFLGEAHLNRRELESEISVARIGVLDYFHDEKVYGPILDTLKNKDEAKRLLAEMIAKLEPKLYRQQGNTALQEGETLTLREVHPNIAMFRGYVGNDCSTSFSPGFVFTPYDRYYYIFDADNRSLGYFGISLVEINKKPAVFLHTIQGPDITSEQTELIMRAIDLAAPQIWKTDLVVLGPDHSISSNVNFYPIRDRMLKAASGANPQRVTWLDTEYRKVIASLGSTLSYDDPERNHSGRKLKFENRKNVVVQVTTRPFDAKFLKPKIKTRNQFDDCARLLTRF